MAFNKTTSAESWTLISLAMGITFSAMQIAKRENPMLGVKTAFALGVLLANPWHGHQDVAESVSSPNSVGRVPMRRLDWAWKGDCCCQSSKPGRECTSHKNSYHWNLRRTATAPSSVVKVAQIGFLLDRAIEEKSSISVTHGCPVTEFGRQVPN